jgi:hypothetical protein
LYFLIFFSLVSWVTDDMSPCNHHVLYTGLFSLSFSSVLSYNIISSVGVESIAKYMLCTVASENCAP